MTLAISDTIKRDALRIRTGYEARIETIIREIAEHEASLENLNMEKERLEALVAEYAAAIPEPATESVSEEESTAVPEPVPEEAPATEEEAAE